MEIRKAALKDLEEILLLFYETITTINAEHYSSRQISAWASGRENLSLWEKRINDQHFLLAVEDSILGFASMNDQGYIDLLFVHKNYQRRRIALNLLKELEEIARQLELKEVWAEVSITAKPFFKLQGFELTKSHIKKLKGVEFKNSIMTKSIQ